MPKKDKSGQASFTDLWPEWFGLGYEIKGWVIDFETAERWRVKGGYSEEYCLDKVYVLRAWWSKKHQKEGRDPYANFQRACREDWSGRQQTVGRQSRPVPSTNPEDFRREGHGS